MRFDFYLCVQQCGVQGEHQIAHCDGAICFGAHRNRRMFIYFTVYSSSLFSFSLHTIFLSYILIACLTKEFVREPFEPSQLDWYFCCCCCFDFRCQDVYGSHVNIHNGHLCAGNINGKGGTCIGMHTSVRCYHSLILFSCIYAILGYFWVQVTRVAHSNVDCSRMDHGCWLALRHLDLAVPIRSITPMSIFVYHIILSGYYKRWRKINTWIEFIFQFL